MHILIATDGTIDPGKTADLVRRLHEEGDTVTVFTAVHFPRTFLESYAEISGVEELARIAHEAGSSLTTGATAAEHLVAGTTRPVDPQPKTSQPSYFDTVAEKRFAPLSERLTAAGIDATMTWRPSDHQTARTILSVVEQEDVGLLVIGAHGEGGFEGPLGSTATKLVRRSPVPLLFVR